MKTIGVP
jgi:ATP-dependent RNA helicase DDX21